MEFVFVRRESHELPTQPPGNPGFDARLYWRGPVRVNMNWMFAAVLEPDLDLRAGTLDLVETSGFYEYFNPLTGEGLGTDSFGWTAALVLDLLAQN